MHKKDIDRERYTHIYVVVQLGKWGSEWQEVQLHYPRERKKKKKPVLITGNDAITRYNNKNDGSGDGTSMGPPGHVIRSSANEWTSVII